MITVYIYIHMCMYIYIYIQLYIIYIYMYILLYIIIYPSSIMINEYVKSLQITRVIILHFLLAVIMVQWHLGPITSLQILRSGHHRVLHTTCRSNRFQQLRQCKFGAARFHTWGMIGIPRHSKAFRAS